MRWVPVALAALTIGVVAWLGFSPTLAGLTNVGPLECRAVLAPVENGSLIDNLSAQQDAATDAWLADVGYVADGERPTEEQAAVVVANVQALCGEARQTRLAWTVLAAVFGSAATLAGVLAGSRGRTTAPTPA